MRSRRARWSKEIGPLGTGQSTQTIFSTSPTFHGFALPLQQDASKG